jgi:glycosyltransferase involved in cell wall biosynthesis
MKILHTVESYDPVYHGMQQVVKQLSERLVKYGHDVTIATSYHSKRISKIINGVKIEEFKIEGKAITGYNADLEEIERYKKFIISSNFDIITNFAAQQWATDIILPFLSQIKAHKIFVPTGFSEIFNSRYQLYYKSMKDWMKNYDMNIFLSNEYQDINFARVNGIDKIKVITNGASHEEFSKKYNRDIRKKLTISKDHFLIILVGSHTGLKGHREAIKIFENSNIQNATLLIVGNSTSNESVFKALIKFFAKKFMNSFLQKKYTPSCFLTCRLKSFFFKFSIKNLRLNKKFININLSREDTIDIYNEADLFLFPSNIECSPIVLFECLASKTPFLTSDVGNTKEIIKWTKTGELLPTKKCLDGICYVDVNTSTKILEEAYINNEVLKKKSNYSYKLFLEKYTWEKISKQYEEVYLSFKKNV